MNSSSTKKKREKLNREDNNNCISINNASSNSLIFFIRVQYDKFECHLNMWKQAITPNLTSNNQYSILEDQLGNIKYVSTIIQGVLVIETNDTNLF